METLEYLGFAAAICTTAAFVPQVLQILRTGNVDGISLGMYSIFTLGVAQWFAYGVAIGNIPMLAANLVTLILASSVLVLTLIKRHSKQLKQLKELTSTSAGGDTIPSPSL